MSQTQAYDASTLVLHQAARQRLNRRDRDLTCAPMRLEAACAALIDALLIRDSSNGPGDRLVAGIVIDGLLATPVTDPEGGALGRFAQWLAR